ncbi:uncharacterized protein LOC123675990 isoform X2 [Harmonia axyridis]|uniref:uncharacterized protein LOC123675990 isoform X2 n=1 Tax=Harmonia axyridis TaxID=115357 RepID=UPI001E27705B|nr:uncharacterized protein LOC123675990 isoform X2 [Harmonia axyridis]
MVLKLFNINHIFHQGDLSVLMKKSCFVPTCLNSSENAPNKIFIFVPRDTTTRKYWFEAVGLKFVKTTKYCCEDHFNLKEDSVDFYFYKRTRKTPRIKSGIVPHLFLNVCNSNIFHTQLGDTEENISSEDENERDFNILPLMPADTESSTETAKTKPWEKPKIENVAEYFMETSDDHDNIGEPKVKIETDETFFENQNTMRFEGCWIESSGSSTDTASPVNDQTLDIYEAKENFETSELVDNKNFLEIGPGPSESCEQNFSVPFNLGAPEVKIEVDESNESIAQILRLPFVPCTDTLETEVKTEPGLGVDESMPEVNDEGQDFKRDACSSFGEYVATELRSLPLEDRFQIQQEIQDCLSAAVVRRTSKLGASESTKVHNLPS